MKNRRFILMMVLMAFSLSSIYAQYQRREHVIDVGLGLGVGFYNGATYENLGKNASFINGETRTILPREHYLGWWPVNEMLGASIGYRIDRRWTIQLQGYRQRMMFYDRYERVLGNGTERRRSDCFYSAFWNIDAMAMFNIFEYIPEATDVANGALTPYVGLGIGVSVFDSVAHVAKINVYDEKLDTTRRVPLKENQQPGITSPMLGVYVAAELGLKWHIVDGVQLKATCAYQLHNGRDRRGITVGEERGYKYSYIGESDIAKNIEGQLAWSHNVTLSLSVLYALDFETLGSGGRSAYRTNWRKNGMMWMDATNNYKGGAKGRGARSMKRRKPMWLD